MSLPTDKARPVWWGQMYLSVGFAGIGGIIYGLMLLFGDDLGTYAFQLAQVLISIGVLIGLHLLLNHGSLMRSGLWKYVLAAGGAVIVGALFKIQHWPGANMLATSGLIAVIIVYTAHYASKQTKRWSDHLKSAWVIVAFGTAISAFLHLTGAVVYLKPAGMVIFWSAFAAFVLERRNDIPAAEH